MTDASRLRGKKVAILSTHGFEQSELIAPQKTLLDEGATVHVVAPEAGTIRGWNHGQWGKEVPVDRTIAEARPGEYDALVLPGGVMNPDKLRMREDALTFVREFFKEGKPVAAICHGPQILIDCGVVDGREMTSYASIKNDLINAGARWKDAEVVVDEGLVTSRTPEDLPAFMDKMVEEIMEGRHAGQAAGAGGRK